MSDLRKKILSGSFWMVCLQWINRLLGIVSTLILARLLTPQDYGLVGIAIVLAGFLEVMASFGAERHFMRKQDIDQQDFSTLFTIRLLQMSLIGLLMLSISPFMEQLYGDPRLFLITAIVSGAFFIRAFANVGFFEVQRQLKYQSVFIVKFLEKFISFVVTLLAAYYFQDYRAILAGVVTLAFMHLVLTYTVYPVKPCLSFVKFREYWDFSKWVVFSNFSVYARNKFDLLIIGKAFGTETLGNYSMANDLTSMPLTEVVQPVTQVLYNAIAKLNDKDAIQKSVLMTLNVIATFIIPCSLGMYILAEEFVITLLTEKWRAVIPFMQGMSFVILFQAFTMFFYSFFTSQGKVKLLAKLDWVLSIIIVPMYFVLSTQEFAVYFIYFKVVVSSLTMLFFLGLLKNQLHIKFRDVIKQLYRPAIAGVCMYLTLNYCDVTFLSNIWLELLLLVVIGGISYITSLLFTWIILRQDHGVEAFLLSQLRQKY